MAAVVPLGVWGAGLFEDNPDPVGASFRAWLEDPTGSAPSIITGSEAIAMVESTMAARDWSPDLAEPLLDQLDDLPGFAINDEPAATWWTAAGSLLQGYQHHLEGAEQLAYAFSNRSSQVLAEQARAEERSVAGIFSGTVEQTGKDLGDLGQKLKKNSGAIAMGIGLVLGLAALSRLR